jgi:peptidoglycan/LPS O-acetylase OafA/YrhL
MKTLMEVSEGRENSITLIRLIASISVIYGHSFAIVATSGQDFVTRITKFAFTGGVAVDLFFIMSGFLVTASILKRGLTSYLISRALRLFPALWAYLLIVTFVIGPILTNQTLREYFSDPQIWNYLVHLGTGTRTEWFLPGVFKNLRDQAVNGSIWSVIVEIRMYVFVAIVYLLGILRRRALFNAFCFLLVVMVWGGLISVPGLTRFTDNHVALLFLAGAFLYVNKDVITVSPMFMVVAMAIAGMTVGTDKFVYGYDLVIIGLFMLCCFSKVGAFMDKYGDYSYGIYLWGWPIQQIVMSIWPHATQQFNASVSIVAALFVGMASWHFIEKPALGLKDRFAISKLFPALRSASSPR